MKKERKMHPEPVPTATQLAVLPFLAAIEGFLVSENDEHILRITMHRIMAREKHRYIQQVCTYFGGTKDQAKAGRLFPAGTGLMGKAASDGKIWRTKKYDELRPMLQDLQNDLKSKGSDASVEPKTPISFLSIPLIGADGETVLVLYAESNEFNFFADDSKVEGLVKMCSRLCMLFDWLVRENPFPTLRNFLTRKVEFRTTEPTAFMTVNEAIDCAPPKFEHLTSFNFETIPN